ncbi:isopentenyl-diphosphate Delta-isomerase [Plasmodiophora brassicae]|uniref:isopentenyl-diphosphate Delta-isomerase n=1 Tax=Plasmodiophora brassicae TaxID=37360 RepID=A0A0G4IQE9_PLABS|nr:hypothetical protein PBRA_000780 [Plasmodiophora brassicae]SPQ97746.1 unnamed protein product [Plasmodiophora brassicae]
MGLTAFRVSWRCGLRRMATAMDPVQRELMSETIALVDVDDRVLGSASKRECHERTAEHPGGRLHRAFSVFLFDTTGRLMLQQRAKSKITFPMMWTNTCCSHPWHTEAELDDAQRIGIKRAAVRKLGDELGIRSVDPNDLRFITRIEYQAFQGDGIWVEHEMDYILFCQVSAVKIDANPNEVAAWRWVTKQELHDLMGRRDSLGMVFTPWFDLIAQGQLGSWWDRLSDVISKEPNESKIHRLGVYDAPTGSK